MSKDTGGPAYPGQELNTQIGTESIHRGMTLLDWFAGQVVAGISNDDNLSPFLLADFAYKTAEAMIAEKRKREASRE